VFRITFFLQAYRQDCETFAVVVKMLVRYGSVFPSGLFYTMYHLKMFMKLA